MRSPVLLFAPVLTVFAMAGFPVNAQPVTEYTKTAYTLYNVCAGKRDAGNAQETLDICTTIDEGFVSLRTMVPGASTEETDYVVFLQAAVRLAITGSAVNVDGARTARVCEATERAWQTLGEITPGSSTMQTVAATADDTAGNVRLCRGEHGTPAWARPLP